MSGVIFMFEEENTVTTDAPRNDDITDPLPLAESLDSPKLNPLLCYLCNEQYREPCILQCFHSYCAACLVTKIHDGKVTCPLCGVMTIIKDGSAGPAPDQLLQFLVESSSADRVQCANCDAIESQMYFCNTCSQPLCPACREETHRPRMFAQHEIGLLSKHTREIQRQCKIHGEPYILFSTEKKLMLCINCFRDMKVESRSHCVDMETAYKQGCQKLDNTMQSIRDLQHSVRDAILLLKALLEEIEKNAERERIDIAELYDTMQEKISETKQSLLLEIKRQYEEKRTLFKEQLVSLSTFLPTLHVHLVTCAAFSSSANRFEFLDLTYVLMERLKSIIQVQYPLHPSQGSEIITDYKAKFAKCLEPLLFPHRNNGNINVPASKAASMSTPRLDSVPLVTASVSNLLGSGGSVVYTQAHSGGRRYSHNMAKVKRIDDSGFFAQHCKEFDDSHRELMQKVEKLKIGVQELQRDLTLRRCLAKDTAMGELTTRISATEGLLDVHSSTVEQQQSGLENHWQKCLERIAGEQEVYKAQLQDVARLKSETQSVKTILQRLSSFVSSIANVTERIAPKLASLEQEKQHAALLHDIITVTPDSQQRVDAIRTAQEVREEKAANRTNPLDEELIKTKGLLRAPSARKDPARRESREIKEPVTEEEGDSKKLIPESDIAGECKKPAVESDVAGEIHDQESKSTEGENIDIESTSKQAEVIDTEAKSKLSVAEGTTSAASTSNTSADIESQSKQGVPEDEKGLDEPVNGSVVDNTTSDETVEHEKDVTNGAIIENSVMNDEDVKVVEDNAVSVSNTTTTGSNNQIEEHYSNEASDICTDEKKTVQSDINTQSPNLNSQPAIPNTMPDVTINTCSENTTETDDISVMTEDELSAEFTIKLELSDSNGSTETSLENIEDHFEPANHANGREDVLNQNDENDRHDECAARNDITASHDRKGNGIENNDDVLKCDQYGETDLMFVASNKNSGNTNSQQTELKVKSTESNGMPGSTTETLEKSNNSSAIYHTDTHTIEDVEMSEIESRNQVTNGTGVASAKGKEVVDSQHTATDTDISRMNEFVLFSNDNNNPIKRLKPVEKAKEKPEAKCSVDDEDDEYITKSLPELAQVFQPGELIKKKQRTKSDSSKSPQDPGKEIC